MVSLRAELAKIIMIIGEFRVGIKRSRAVSPTALQGERGRYLCHLYNSNHIILFPGFDLTILDPHSGWFCL